MGTFEMRLRDYERLGRSLGRKEGIKIGEEQGMKAGMKLGENSGRAAEKLQTVQKLLAADQSADFIAQITGMPKEEILEIQRSQKNKS
ncbi:MAG: hypothetical protein Q4C55_05550 [Eubacterium sp.]|nr:hypothetical protein [Eubacterium sp.]